MVLNRTNGQFEEKKVELYRFRISMLIFSAEFASIFAVDRNISEVTPQNT